MDRRGRGIGEEHLRHCIRYGEEEEEEDETKTKVLDFGFLGVDVCDV